MAFSRIGREVHNLWWATASPKRLVGSAAFCRIIEREVYNLWAWSATAWPGRLAASVAFCCVGSEVHNLWSWSAKGMERSPCQTWRRMNQIGETASPKCFDDFDAVLAYIALWRSVTVSASMEMVLNALGKPWRTSKYLYLYGTLHL